MFCEVSRRAPYHFSFNPIRSPTASRGYPVGGFGCGLLRATSCTTFCLLCNPPFYFPPRPPAQRPAVPRHSSQSNLVTCDADTDATPRNANDNDNANADADAHADADAEATARHATPCHARHSRPTRRDATPRHGTSNRVSLELRSLSPQLLGGRASQTGPLL